MQTEMISLLVLMAQIGLGFGSFSPNFACMRMYILLASDRL